MHEALTPQSEITLPQYRAILRRCEDLFGKKVADYGTSWRVLRPISILDQIYIKAWRIRQIQEDGRQRISDSIESEYAGIINYGIIALIQQSAGDDGEIDWTAEQAKSAYEKEAVIIERLMMDKNADYGEAWRQMSQQSFVDLILVKLLRIKQIIANEGRVQVSEGADANYMDIVNYAVFALILLSDADKD